MASLAHVAVGVMAGRLHGGRNRSRRLIAMAAFGALSMLPDCDVIPVALGVRDSGPFGHRGFSHTFFFSALFSFVIGLCARRWRLNAVSVATLSFLTLASHGILDVFTADTRGVALFWPFSSTVIVAAIRPIPDAPTGIGFLSWRGLQGAALEVLFFLPLFVFAAWPQPIERSLGKKRRALANAFVLSLAVATSLGIGQALRTNVPAVERAWQARAPVHKVRPL